MMKIHHTVPKSGVSKYLSLQKGKTFEELKKELGEGNEAMSLVKKVRFISFSL